MLKRIAVLLVLSAMTGLGLAQEPITIGVNLELSGRFATIGTSTLQGIQAAQEQMPTVDGRQVELSICDNQTTPEGSINCAARFVDEGVIGVLGAISSTMSIAAAEPLEEAGIIMISTSSTNPATTQIGEHIFRMAYTDDFQGRVAARYAADDLSAERAIVFRQQDDDYSFGLAGFFAEEFEALGGETIILDFVANTVDFSAQINDARGFDADVIYYSGFCAEGASLMPQLRQQGFDQQILGADASDDSQCPVGGGEAFDGYIFTGFGGPEVLSGEAAERALDFESFFQVAFPDASDFNGFTLAGADAYNVLVEAVANAGSADPDEVLTALQNLEGYAGVSGEITYAGTDGTPDDRTIGFFEYSVPGEDGGEWSSEALFGLGTGE
jgi:branched-chain amino acid transport system substrate-binding protein